MGTSVSAYLNMAHCYAVFIIVCAPYGGSAGERAGKLSCKRLAGAASCITGVGLHGHPSGAAVAFVASHHVGCLSPVQTHGLPCAAAVLVWQVPGDCVSRACLRLQKNDTGCCALECMIA